MTSPERATTTLSLTRVILQILFVIVAVAFGLWAVQRLAPVLYVLIAAAVFAYVIAPLVQLAERPLRIAGRRRHLPRGIAVGVVYVFLAGTLSTAAALLLPSAMAQVNDMMSGAPAYVQLILTWTHEWTRYYARLRIPIELRQSIDRSVFAAAEAAVETARGSAMTLVGRLSDLPWLILIPILAFFLLKDAATVRRSIVTALPYRIRLRGHRLFDEMNATLASYVRAQLLACALVGCVCGIGFAVLRIPYPVPLGLLAGALEFIPLVGPLLLAILASIDAALRAPALIVWVVGFLAIVRLLEDDVIYPRLIRRNIHLHPLAVIVAVLAGAELDGVAGMFLAVPTAAIAAVVYRHWMTWRAALEASAPIAAQVPAHEPAPSSGPQGSAAPGPLLDSTNTPCASVDPLPSSAS